MQLSCILCVHRIRPGGFLMRCTPWVGGFLHLIRSHAIRSTKRKAPPGTNPEGAINLCEKKLPVDVYLKQLSVTCSTINDS